LPQWFAIYGEVTVLLDGVQHKELTYVEYRAVPGVFQNIDPPSPSPPGECVLPQHPRQGYTLAGR
jgi:hypothetical protein